MIAVSGSDVKDGIKKCTIEERGRSTEALTYKVRDV